MFHSIIKLNGKFYGSGNNEDGQLGLGYYNRLMERQNSPLYVNENSLIKTFRIGLAKRAITLLF